MSINKCPNCGKSNFDTCFSCQFCGIVFEKTKEECEEVIDKHFDNWRNTYINMIWNNLKDNQVFYIEDNLGIVRVDGTYKILEGEKNNEG